MNSFFPSLLRSITSLGLFVRTHVEQWGAAWTFLLATLTKCATPPFRGFLVTAQFFSIGVQSMLVIALIGGFTGAVLAVQAVYTLTKFGATGYTGSAVSLSLIRELGPVLTALMVIGRAGSAITAEIGIMRITEQIDALRSMAVDPLRYLMAPRLIAGTISVPLLSAIFITVGIGGGYLVAVGLLQVSSGTFLSEMYSAVTKIDIYAGAIKALAFGFVFAWVSCYKGYTCGYGATGVNKATTQSVVTSSVAVLVLDYFLTSILTRVFL
jgi:phospholipid/cholesterol/gamma-HCH transport system permease protein